jgi:hypothetical protein
MLGQQFASLNLFTVRFRINRMKVNLIIAGHKGQYLFNILPEFVRISRLARIIASCLYASVSWPPSKPETSSPCQQ